MFGDFGGDEVKALRDHTGLGLRECQMHLERSALLAFVDAATSVEDLRRVLRHLVEVIYPNRVN